MTQIESRAGAAAYCGRPGEYPTIGLYKRGIDDCPTLARPRHVPAAARARLVTDERPARAEPVAPRYLARVRGRKRLSDESP